MLGTEIKRISIFMIIFIFFIMFIILNNWLFCYVPHTNRGLKNLALLVLLTPDRQSVNA